LREFKWRLNERIVALARMHPRQPRAPPWGKFESGVLDTERTEQAFIEEILQHLAACSFNRLAGPVDADAVFPTLAGLKAERQVERLVFARHQVRNAGRLQIAQQIGIQEVIAESRRMGE